MNFDGHLNFSSPEKVGPPQMHVPTVIHNARERYGVVADADDATELLLNGAGFLLVHAPSLVENWADAKEVARVHYDEALELSRKLLPGFDFSPITSHTFREEKYKEHFWVDGIQYGPAAEFVHNDYADFVAADGRTVKKTFPEVMGMPTGKRTVGINIWRSVTDTPLERFPLAVCDRTTVDLDDLVYELNPNAPKPFNAHYCRANQGQNWNYYSDMTKDEALVFTTYDSAPDDGLLFRPTLHTAVAIPGTEKNMPRVSVEVRFFGRVS